MSSSIPTLHPTLDPCHNVRRTCRILVEDCAEDCSVKIRKDEAMTRLVQSMLDSTKTSSTISWDAEGWHYTGRNGRHQDPEVRIERVFLYVLALDAINFCFWPPTSDDVNDGSTTNKTNVSSNTLEYDHLSVALTKLAEQDDNVTTDDSYFFDPHNLVSMTPTQMKTALQPFLLPHRLPNISERCRMWNQVGAVLLSEFPDTSSSPSSYCRSLLQKCDYSAPKLVQWIVSHIPGFRDEAVWTGSSRTENNNDNCTLWVAFYKRAQILVGDWQAALQDSGVSLQDMDQLTTFADYRVPQLLRHCGVLEYSIDLASLVDAQDELAVGSKHELSIRAATVVAVEELVQCYNKNAERSASVGCASTTTKMTSVLMDWYLWQVGEKMNQEGQLKPHHRVRTIFY